MRLSEYILYCIDNNKKIPHAIDYDRIKHQSGQEIINNLNCSHIELGMLVASYRSYCVRNARKKENITL